MSDLRLDPITGHWVAIAANRIDRPNEFQIQQNVRQAAGRCPFCPGNEAETPEPTLVLEDATQKTDWLLRVVPNKYPSFPNNGQLVNPNCGPYANNTAHGVQEVIIQSPRHIESISELNEHELSASFTAFRDRVRDTEAIPEIEHVMLFQNCRAEAGASLQHIHSQLIGTPIVPDQLNTRWQRMHHHVQQKGISILESITDWELQQESRVLEVTERFAAYCPYASRFGYQVWIVPLIREVAFSELTDDDTRQLATICQRYISRLESQLNSPAYNMLFHFSTLAFSDFAHWFVEIFPRITRPAGFEWGTGWWVNPYAPEDVAKSLRGKTSDAHL